MTLKAQPATHQELYESARHHLAWSVEHLEKSKDVSGPSVRALNRMKSALRDLDKLGGML